MPKDKVPEIFNALMSDEKFRNEYLMAYLDRFVYTATDLESGLTSEKRKIAIENLLHAFKYLMGQVEGKLSPFDIKQVGDFVNKVDGIEGFRKIEVTAGRYAEWTPTKPKNIYFDLYSLLDNYYNVWQDRDVYEKEAAFHIGFMRIHPFEDGNKRVAKIMSNANLVKQGYPPVIITEEETEIYYDFINKMNEVEFANFLKSKSRMELSNLISNYKINNNIPITDSIDDILKK